MASRSLHQHPDPVRSLLDTARSSRRVAEDADRRTFIAAADWAAAHPATDMDDAACVPGTERELAIAGAGAPLVAEFCIDEFAAAIGISTDAGYDYVGDAWELRSRLPRCWARLVAGEVVVWRARRIAQATRLLSPKAVALADQRLASSAHSTGGRGIERTVAAAEAHADPDVVALRKSLNTDHRKFDVHTGYVDLQGNVEVHGYLELMDAVHLDSVVAGIADQYKTLGSTDSLDARRAKALGELARREIPMTLGGWLDTTDEANPLNKPGSTSVPRAKKNITLYVHLNQGAVVTPFGTFGPTARVENTRTPIGTDTLRSWCADPDTQLAVRPVLDLAEHRSSECYEIPDLLREQVILRDRTCVFPHCTRPARSGDIDHIVPWDSGGTTATENLAALCRRHHRLKTHTKWRYAPLDPRWLRCDELLGEEPRNPVRRQAASRTQPGRRWVQAAVRPPGVSRLAGARTSTTEPAPAPSTQQPDDLLGVPGAG